MITSDIIGRAAGPDTPAVPAGLYLPTRHLLGSNVTWFLVQARDNKESVAKGAKGKGEGRKPSGAREGPKGRRESRCAHGIGRAKKGKGVERRKGVERYFTGFACGRTLIIFVPSGMAGLILSRSA